MPIGEAETTPRERMNRYYAALKGHGLTWKQAEVAMHVATHRSEEETATEIGCHISAVKKRLNGVKKKLGTEKLRHTAARVQEIYEAWRDSDGAARVPTRGNHAP